MANYTLTHTGSQVDDAVEKALRITDEAIDSVNETVDYIVEQGVDSNGWTYRKWNSGIAEAWKKGTISNVPVTRSVGSGSVLYRSDAVSLGYPSGVSFKTITYSATTASASNTYVWAGQDATESSTIVFGYISSTIPTLTLSTRFIGTWK